MKRKNTNSSTKELFAGCVFVISKEEPKTKEIQEKIKELGGKVADKITKNITYFVQGYDYDDDGRLATVKKYNGTVISPSFIHLCATENRIVPFHEYGIGPPVEEETKTKKSKTKNTKTQNKNNNDNNILSKAFKIPENIYDDLFKEIREGDREDEEFPQTFGDFVGMEDKNIPTKTKKYIYILPIGYKPTREIEKEKEAKKETTGKKKDKEKEEYNGIQLDIVEEFLQIFFGVETKVLPNWEIVESKKKQNIVVGKKRYPIETDNLNRLQVMDILEVMWDYIPKDAVCVVGLLLHDIFECHWDQNQYWGRATGDGCSVISLNRFNPSLDKNNDKEKSMSRSLNTIVHESMHVFGLDHCVFYKCNMNSSEAVLTNLDETLHLCPIDLRKLHHTFQFDIKERYEKLLQFYKKHNFKFETEWVTKRLQTLI